MEEADRGDAGGSTRTDEIEATRAGRRVDLTHGRGVVEVTGTPVEHPASRPAPCGGPPEHTGPGRELVVPPGGAVGPPEPVR